MEIQSVKKVEILKQELMSFQDFSMLEIFRHIDQFAHGHINSDNLRVFFRSFEFCSDLDEEDLLNWIRRYDRDVDQKLDYADFVTSLGPYCQYTQKAQNIQQRAQLQQDPKQEEQNSNYSQMENYPKIDSASAMIQGKPGPGIGGSHK